MRDSGPGTRDPGLGILDSGLATRDLEPRIAIAWGRAEIREGLAGDRNELPLVTFRLQRQLQHTVRAADRFAVRPDALRGVEMSASRSDHELSKAATQIGPATGVLRPEALVEMIVAREHDLGTGLLQDGPDVAHHGVVAVRPGA